MKVNRIVRLAELTDAISKELRGLAFEMGWDPDQTEPKPAQEAPKLRKPRARRLDTLIRLEDAGYIREGTVLVPISRILPPHASGDLRFQAVVDKNPTRPIWAHTGDSMRSLSALSITLRDEFGVAFPFSSFNPCKYWRIEEEKVERTLEDIAQQMVI